MFCLLFGQMFGQALLHSNSLIRPQCFICSLALTPAWALHTSRP